MNPERSRRVILHIDMDAFFASVEQRVNPFLRGKPVLVCGNKSSRTVVATASYEARSLGVAIAMTLPEALRLCPDAILVEGNPAKYLDTFQRVLAIIERYSPTIEVFSIDEAFVEITDTAERFGGPWEVAKAIQRTVNEELGLPCSIGIGPNKLIAKLSSSRKKPNGIVWMHPEEIPAVLEALPIEELCGIGDALKRLLNDQGIFTCGELARVPVERLIAWFGRCRGEHLAAIAKGSDDSPLIPADRAEAAKSMGHLQTLAHDTTNLDVLKAVLLNLSEKVGRRLRMEGASGRTVYLTVREADFSTRTCQRTLDRFLETGFELYQVGCQILESLRLSKPIRMIGISVSGLTDKERQLEWLPEAIRHRRLLQAMDRINDRFGEGTVRRAVLRLFDEPSHHYQLKRYTSRTMSRGLWNVSCERCNGNFSI